VDPCSHVLCCCTLPTRSAHYLPKHNKQESVSEAVAADPTHYVVADKKWTDATEQMLEAVTRHFERLSGRQILSAAAVEVQQGGVGAAGGGQQAAG